MLVAPGRLDADLTFTDISCGAGGSSSIGLADAGFRLVLGANHWRRAIETHSANFPDAEHIPVRAPHHPRHLLPASKAGRWQPGTIISVAGHCAPISVAREAMGIDWLPREQLREALPPDYTHCLGARLLEYMTAAGMEAAS